MPLSFAKILESVEGSMELAETVVGALVGIGCAIGGCPDAIKAQLSPVLPPDRTGSKNASKAMHEARAAAKRRIDKLLAGQDPSPGTRVAGAGSSIVGAVAQPDAVAEAEPVAALETPDTDAPPDGAPGSDFWEGESEPG